VPDHEEDLLLVCGIIVVKAQWLSGICICDVGFIAGVANSITRMGNCFDRIDWDGMGLDSVLLSLTPSPDMGLNLQPLQLYARINPISFKLWANLHQSHQHECKIKH